MKKTLSILFIFALLLCKALAQTAPEVVVPAFDDVYSKTVKKLEAGETSIDYRTFRESFIESEQFLIAGKRFHEFDSLTKLMYQQMDEAKYEDIIKTTKAMLSIDYTSMKAHKILQQTYKIIGDTVNSKKYHDIEFGLLKSITRSGDGKTCATAWIVTQIEEEYFILEMVGATFKKQTLDNDGGLCDKMDVKENGKRKTYYFDVRKVFEGYKKQEKKE